MQPGAGFPPMGPPAAPGLPAPGGPRMQAAMAPGVSAAPVPPAGGVAPGASAARPPGADSLLQRRPGFSNFALAVVSLYGMCECTCPMERSSQPATC